MHIIPRLFNHPPRPLLFLIAQLITALVMKKKGKLYLYVGSLVGEKAAEI